MKTPWFKALAFCLFIVLGGASTSLRAQVDKTPVLHLSFDQVSGTTVGSIVTNGGSGGSAMNGTLNGGATIVAGGKFGNALNIAGTAASDASARIANAVVPLNVGAGQPAWSVAMWFQSTTVGGCFAYQGGGGWAGGNSMFYLTSGRSGGGTSGTHAGAVRNGQEWQEGITDVNDGLWHHYVLTFDGSTKTMYLDGQVETFDENNWNGDGTGNQFWIGGNPFNGDGSTCLNGLIDEVYVFNQALSLSDVQGLTNNTLPIVPVAVTLNPASGYRGQVFTVTATATPAVGTVTNASGNLSALNLSAATNLVQSSVNVFTNTFTVPANAPVGGRNVKVTVTSTEPLVGSGGATFTVIARPPTNAILVTQLAPVSAYQYTEASFFFGTTNDAPNDAPFPMAYSWYTNSVLVSSNMGPRFTFLTTPADNGMQVYAIARVADPLFSSLSVTSVTVSLTVNPGSVVYTNGLKEEFFGGGATRQGVQIGNVGPGVVRLVTVADSAGGFGDNTTRRYSGYFIPPATDGYVFFVAGDDDTDVFLSTDSSPTNKQLIAQETGWSGTRNWQTPGGGSTAGQKRSDQWSPDGGTTIPYSGGIQLVAGQKYYFESVVHNGGGGDNWAVTFQTTNELALDPSQPVDGSASRMTAATNNIALITYPGTTISWVTQPPAAVAVYEGQNTNFISLATSDAELVPFYQWYLNNAPIGGNTATLSLNAIPFSYNNAQIKVVASTIGGLSVTSTVTTLTVIQSVFEPGWVAEKKWMNTFNINGAEAGTITVAASNFISGARPGFIVGRNNPSSNVPGRPFNELDSSLQQVGLFIAPSNGNYVFFISSHDGGNLFLSTNNTPAAKRLIAQEQGWTSGWNWNTVGAAGTLASQKRSDTYSPNGGVTFPYSNGIPLVAGQKYYMEVTHTTSRWGNERCGVIYQIMDENGFVPGITDPTVPTTATGGAIEDVSGMNAIRCSSVTISQQPASVASVEGSSAAFSVAGTSDSLYPLISPDGYTITQPSNTLICQWYKILGGVTNAVPGATGLKMTTGPLTMADNNAQYYCAVRALGYSDNALNRIWTNSQPATLTVTARTPSLLGRWFNGTASLADSANYVAPGVYDGFTNGVGSYFFTNDVPPGAPAGVSLRLQGAGVIVSNTATTDPGYVVGTFDENIQNTFTIAFWAKGLTSGWNPWVSKNGENWGWQMRHLGFGTQDQPTFTVRGAGGAADPVPNRNSEGNNWHYYAGTFDTTTGFRTLYLDGRMVSQEVGQTPYTLASGSHLVLGGRQNNNGTFGNYFTGNLYEVRIYNYALTQEQVINVGGVPPPLDSEVVGGQLVLTWPIGTLLQATNVLGPWTTNSTVSPAKIDMTLPQQFFSVKNP